MALWPSLDSRIDHGLLVVAGVVQPTPIALPRRIRVTYRDYGIPKAYVTAPKLSRRPHEPEVPIPHTYEYAAVGREHPCLYYPKGREWTAAMPIAFTILPWLMAWLADYEIWYATGEWMGGGMTHGQVKSPEALSADDEVA